MLPRVVVWVMSSALGALVMAQSAKIFRVSTIDGRMAVGALAIGIDGGVRVLPDHGDELVTTIADLLLIEALDALPAVLAAPLYVWLRSGSRLPITSINGTAATDGKPASVDVSTPSGVTFSVPLSMLAALRCREVEPKTFANDRESPELNLDFLFVVKDGKPQRFSVTVDSIHDGKVHFALGAEAYDFPLLGDDSAAAIVFGKNTGFAPDRQGKPRVSVALRTGEQFDGRLLSLGETVQVKLDEGAEVKAPTAQILRIDVLSDKLTWLSSLAGKTEQTPAFDRVWPWTIDRSLMGKGLVIAGKVFAHGLVLVPRTRITYELDGRYDSFEAMLGIDDRGGPQAHAIFRVMVDGKTAFESEPMTLGMPAKPIRVELAKCRVFAIEADFGKNFDIGDLCTFADARLLQK